jgi:UDP-N-acetylmuramate dehydrogenase
MNIEIKRDVSLAEFTTFKIGGNARFFVEATNEEQIVETISFAKENDFNLFILGGGSNVLISDSGFDGVVLKISTKGIENQAGLVTAKAGEDWDEFVLFSVSNSLQGIECLSGIPGLVGSTPIQNVGAYGQEVSESIDSVAVYDRKSGNFLELSNADCQFSYRTSIFNSTQKNRFVVLSVSFRLNETGLPKIVYRDLIETFGSRVPTLLETREAVCKIRSTKAMMVRQKGADSQSAGSFFKNPIVSKEFHLEIQKNLKLAIPSFNYDDANVKLPAAWLIEHSGFSKGFLLGNAGLSTKHTLALTNRGHASSTDVLVLKNEIQCKVKKVFDVELVPEPIFVGF